MKRFPYLSRKFLAKRDEIGRAHPIDVAQCAAGKWREAEADDRADIGLARIGDDAVLDHPRRLDRLGHEEPLLELADVDPVRIKLRSLKCVKTRPQGLWTLARDNRKNPCRSCAHAGRGR